MSCNFLSNIKDADRTRLRAEAKAADMLLAKGIARTLDSVASSKEATVDETPVTVPAADEDKKKRLSLPPLVKDSEAGKDVEPSVPTGADEQTRSVAASERGANKSTVEPPTVTVGGPGQQKK